MGIIQLIDKGFTLLRMNEMRLPEDPFTYEELKVVVGLLTRLGHVWQLEFGQFVLLHPERINSYAAAVGRTVRSHLQQIGVIHESAMLAGRPLEPSLQAADSTAIGSGLLISRNDNYISLWLRRMFQLMIWQNK